jgi:hypothetical protein
VSALEALISKIVRGGGGGARFTSNGPQGYQPMPAPFEGRIFSEPVARAARGSSLLSKGPSHLMLRSRGCSFASRAHLFRRCNRARSGRRGQADVTACHGPPVSTP